MNPNAYIRSIIRKYRITNEQREKIERVSRRIYPIIRRWSYEHLIRITKIGSFVKNTKINIGSDIDLFISLKHTIPVSLRDMYLSLFYYLKFHGYNVKEQNVSLNVNFNNISIDLVPGKKQEGLIGDHSLYKKKSDSWIKTNVYRHIKYVKDANCSAEIKVLKIWKHIFELDIPSTYLELMIIEALRGYSKKTISQSIIHILEYLYDNIENKAVIDPTNSNNMISDEIGSRQKHQIKQKAVECLNSNSWNYIIW